ncbi:uncharacterized protein tmem119a [Clupea harengus]|uniref:Uncharacterized protein tmem119a n=1 Tax=Clupea harengus TaxID=7950 RepID=A0A6P8FIG9_CLUHA|nr:uncharacterized protein tmem119a [Clupea harengus]
MGLSAWNLPCVVAVLICWSATSICAFPLNITMEMSGDGVEAELFPAVLTTHIPVPVTPTQKVSTITTTIIRLKDFVFSQVVDVLKENLLLFTVVTSLLIVIIFIVCCASAMSHKRKLDTFYPPTKKYLPRTYMDHGAAQSKNPQPQATTATAKSLRTPSKALVGPKEGKDPRPKPLEVPAVQEVEEVDVEMQRDEPKVASDPRSPGQSTSPAVVCTCHLRKGTHPAE